MLKLLTNPYPVTRGWKKELFWSLLTIAVASILLFLFRPFGLANIPIVTADQFLYTLIMLLMIYAIAIQVILAEFISTKLELMWTTGKEIIFTTFYLMGVAFLIYGTALSFSLTRLTVFDALVFMLMTLGISIMPVSLTVLLKQNWLLKKTLTSIEQLPAVTADHNSVSGIILHGSSNESLSLNLTQLLVIKGQQNYSEVIYLSQQEIKQKLLRITLAALQEQLSSTSVIRCHRSYLVNLQNVDSINGNAQGYQLMLHQDLLTAPVSRSYIPAFNAAWKSFCENTTALNNQDES